MPVQLQCENFVLTDEEARRLWDETIRYRDFLDDEVTVRCVSEAEIQRLNQQYRGQGKPTNVLTFSYTDEERGGHDIALCMAVAEHEAFERGAEVRDYAALLLVHAFLHATGMDHEHSKAEVKATEAAEQAILKQAGFAADTLLHC